jgi:hypothetical protein
VRAERDGGPLLSRQIRISDLPNDEEELPDPEPRSLSWNEKLLGVRLPCGPRGSEWGLTFMGPDGALFDERPVARRIERIDVALGIKDARPVALRQPARAMCMKARIVGHEMGHEVAPHSPAELEARAHNPKSSL